MSEVVLTGVPQFDNLELIKIAQVSRLVPSLVSLATDTLTVPHNLGYIPILIAFLNGTGSTYLTTGTYYSVPQIIPVTVGAEYTVGIMYTYSLDETNIYFNVSNYSSLTITDIGTATWNYYLLRSRAKTQ